MDNVNDWLDYMNESLTCEERRIVTEHLADQRQEQYVERIAQLEAELAATKAELAGWQEIGRMVDELHNRGLLVRKSVYKTGKWYVVVSDGPTPPLCVGNGDSELEAVKAAYEEVVGEAVKMVYGGG